MRGKLSITIASLTFLAALAPSAQAEESVTLRNGFAVQCHHHAQVDGRVRLYLTAGVDNYIEFAPEEIADVALIADPLPQPDSATQVAAASSLRSASNPAATLSPADLHEILAKAGTAHNVDEDLLASVVKAESGGNVRAVSRTGARGLMQLMPGTANELGVADSFQPEQNVRGGTAYLDALLTRYHDNMALALAAYNAGPLAVDRYHGIPPYHETQAYVARVIHEFNRRVLAREALAKRALASASAPSQ
ncbi:MAG: lytic transglycosylase domain-containing protein [Terracidiphilus sp.]